MPKFNWHKGNRFPTYGNYTGPGNRTDPDYLREHRPVDRLDRAAKFHDLAYKQLQKEGRNPYFRFSKADQLFLDRVSGISGIPARVASGAFQVKKALNSFFGVKSLKRKSMVYQPMSGSDLSDRTPRKRPKNPKPKGGRSRLSSGHYAGKLRPIKRARPPTVADKRGFSQEFERYGTQTLNDVCYLGATSVCKNDIGPIIGIAFYRKIMKKHYGFEYSHPDQFINPIRTAAPSYAGTGPIQIRFWRRTKDPTGVAADTLTVGHNYDLYNPNAASAVPPVTLREAGLDFYTNVLSLAGFGGGNGATVLQQSTISLYGYQFVEADYTVAQPDNNGAVVNRYSIVHLLDRQRFTCYSTVKFAIQNVTPADDGSLVTTKVDVNPIKGKLMTFKDILPVVRVPIAAGQGLAGSASSDGFQALQCDNNGDGIIKPATSLSGAWTQIPTASMFHNAKRELSIALSPGSIKDFKISFKYSGTIQNFIVGMNHTIVGLGSSPMSGARCFGTSFLFMLEKRMPTGSAPVIVNFHYESYCSAVFGGRPGVSMQRGAGASTAVSLA